MYVVISFPKSEGRYELIPVAGCSLRRPLPDSLSMDRKARHSIYVGSDGESSSRRTHKVSDILLWTRLCADVSAACRSIGISNFSVGDIQVLLASAKVKPAVNQVHPFNDTYTHVQKFTSKFLCH